MTKRTRPTVATAIRFDPPIHAQLRKISDENDLSVNWLVNRAVGFWLRTLTAADPAVFDRFPTLSEVSEP